MTHRATRWLSEDESKGERKVLQATATIYPTRLAPKHHSRTDPEALIMVDSEALSWRIDQRGEMRLSLLTKLPFCRRGQEEKGLLLQSRRKEEVYELPWVPATRKSAH